VALAACGGGIHAPRAASARLVTNGDPAVRAVVRGCRTSNPSVPVGSGLPPGWRSASHGTIIAGPVAWRSLGRATYPLGTLAPHDGLAPAVKIMAIVADGEQARVVVPADERKRLSLDYNDAVPRDQTRMLFRVSNGASQVTFEGCPASVARSPWTQFAGGFIVDGPQCARIYVYSGHDEHPISRQIPFGVPERTCVIMG
jgi:hypothetical protein